MTQQRILVADDEDLFRLVVVNTLEAAGYATAEAADGIEAIAQVDAVQPGLVLLDLNMPNLDGWAVVDRIREKPSKPRIVIMTGAGDRDVVGARVDCLSGFLTKPFQTMTLLRTCEVALHAPPIVDPGPSRKERRRTFVCDATVAVAPGIEAEPCRVLEVSATGFRIESSAALALGDRLQISLNVPGRARALQLNGQVRWLRDPLTGGSIESLTTEDAELVHDLVSVLL